MKHNWRGSPARLYISCLATALHMEGLRGQKIVDAVNTMVPHWRDEFDGPVTDNALVQRTDKALRYDAEKPWINKLKKPLWRQAKEDTRRRKCSFDFARGAP